MATETVKFNLRLPTDLKASLEAQAAAQDLSLNQLVVKVLRRERKAQEAPVSAPKAAPVRRAVPAKVVAVVKVGRNEPCPCGSGKKAKFCCPALTR